MRCVPAAVANAFWDATAAGAVESGAGEGGAG
jgi:hypothetical protein